LRYTFYTQLGIEECKKVLNKSLKNSVFASRSAFFGHEGYFGKVNENKFSMVKLNKHVSSVNRMFYGYLEETEEGTLIKGEWKYPPFARIFLAAFLVAFISTPLTEIVVLLCKVTGIELGDLISSSIKGNYDAIFISISPLLVLAIIGLFRVFSSDQEYDVKQELKRILQVYKEEKKK